LDEDNLVIGKVLSGMEVVGRINDIPVSREDSLGSKAAFSNAGKGFDPRAKLASVDRPLKQIKVMQCQVDEKANNVASFLKF
jgi:cyclophilin family peptidyl-prolyl cis-trans isomerase